MDNLRRAIRIRLANSIRRLCPPFARWLRWRWGHKNRLGLRLVRRQGLVVGSGPFAGMKYLDISHGSFYLPKLVGSYESELHDAIRALASHGFKNVVNIGCGEGYYAVGMAMLMPLAGVKAFDFDAGAQASCRELARINGVADRVDVSGACDLQTFAQALRPGSLVLCDCEGCENQLLIPDAVPALRDATLLVELHDCFVPGTTAELRRRFAETHELAIMDAAPRDPSDYPCLDGLKPETQRLCLDEGRTIDGVQVAQQWALFVPRTLAELATGLKHAASGHRAGELNHAE